MRQEDNAGITSRLSFLILSLVWVLVATGLLGTIWIHWCNYSYDSFCLFWMSILGCHSVVHTWLQCFSISSLDLTGLCLEPSPLSAVLFSLPFTTGVHASRFSTTNLTPGTWLLSSYFPELQVDKQTAGILPSSSIGMAGSTVCSTKGGIKTSEGLLSEGQPVPSGVSHLAGSSFHTIAVIVC